MNFLSKFRKLLLDMKSNFKQPKFTTSFSSELKPLVSEEKDKFLSYASLQEIGDFIPKVDSDRDIDLLPVAFNACVINRANKNGDVIDSTSATDIYRNFINKPINIEHNREKVIGVILTAGFSEFGTDKPLTEEQASELNAPYNITLGGVLWKIVNGNITSLVEEASDPTSEFYKKISASWELGFSEYEIAVLKDDNKDIAEAEYISDVEQIDEMKAFLRGFGGKGKLENGKSVYRKIVGSIVPLGIGLTENPAAEVEGVLTEKHKVKVEDSKENLEVESSKDDQQEEEGIKTNLNKSEITENISQFRENDVIEDKDCLMEIKTISDITEENLKQITASAVSDYIETELKKASEHFNAEKKEISQKLEESEQQNVTLAEDIKTLKSDFDSVQSELGTLKAEKSEREATDRFNERMSLLDENYELSAEEREVIASDIKDLDDEAFEAHMNKISVLLSHKDRKAIAEAKQAEEAAAAEEKVVEEAVASEDDSEAEEVVEEAIDQAEVEGEQIPVSTAAEEETLGDRYKKAFSIDKFDIKL